MFNYGAKSNPNAFKNRFEEAKISTKHARTRTLSQGNVLSLLHSDSKLSLINNELIPSSKNTSNKPRAYKKEVKPPAYNKPEAYNIMQDLIWSYRKSINLDNEFKNKVIAEVNKYDCRIEPGERYKIKVVTDLLRQQSREKNWGKKIKKGQIKTKEIWKKKEKIRTTKKRLEDEERLRNLPVREIPMSESSTLVPLAKADTRIKFCKSIFDHIDHQKHFPRKLMRETHKIPATHESAGRVDRTSSLRNRQQPSAVIAKVDYKKRETVSSPPMLHHNKKGLTITIPENATSSALNSISPSFSPSLSPSPSLSAGPTRRNRAKALLRKHDLHDGSDLKDIEQQALGGSHVQSAPQARIELKAIATTLSDMQRHFMKEERDLNGLVKELEHIEEGKRREIMALCDKCEKQVKLIEENLVDTAEKPLSFSKLEKFVFVVMLSESRAQIWEEEVVTDLKLIAESSGAIAGSSGKGFFTNDMVKAAMGMKNYFTEKKESSWTKIRDGEEELESERSEIKTILGGLMAEVLRTKKRKKALEEIIAEDEARQDVALKLVGETSHRKMQLMKKAEEEAAAEEASSPMHSEIARRRSTSFNSKSQSPMNLKFAPESLDVDDARAKKKVLALKLEESEQIEAAKQGHVGVMKHMMEKKFKKNKRENATIFVSTVAPTTPTPTPTISSDQDQDQDQESQEQVKSPLPPFLLAPPDTPRQKYIKHNAIKKIQKVFRGTRARVWVNNQALRLFPLRQTNRNFKEGGERGRAIFLEGKRKLLLASQERLQPELERWEGEREKIEKQKVKSILTGGRRERGTTIVRSLKLAQGETKKKLDSYAVQKFLDTEAKQLKLNLRYVAACVIQHYVGNYVKKKFPYLKEVILAQNRKTAVISGHALTRNVSRRAQAFRKFKKAEEAAHKFQVIPIIIRMQRDWREYLNIKHSKREIGAAVALLKRMRANAKSGAELFKELKDEHMKEIKLAVEYNMLLRENFAKCKFKIWRMWSDERLERKRILRQKILKRKVMIISIWFIEIMAKKRSYINRTFPVMFPPLLDLVSRFKRSNDWETFLLSLSSLYSTFDPQSRVNTLDFEEHHTRKVIGFRCGISELNDMLLYHLETSSMRKKPVYITIAAMDVGACGTYSLWTFFHCASKYLWLRSNEAMVANRNLSLVEERGVMDGLLWSYLMKLNLNPPSLSEKFRLRSRCFVRWREKEELCNRCVAVLPTVSGECDVCGSRQMPRYMRNTEATTHTDVECDGVRDYWGGGKFVRSLRGANIGMRNVVVGVEDIGMEIDLFMCQCSMCCLAPVGGWRRTHAVNDVWRYSVRSVAEVIFRLKRRGVLTIGDLWRLKEESGMGVGGMEGLEECMGGEKNLVVKVYDMLVMLDESLQVCLSEEEQQKGVGGFGGGGGGANGEIENASFASGSMFGSRFSSEGSSKLFIKQKKLPARLRPMTR